MFTRLADRNRRSLFTKQKLMSRMDATARYQKRLEGDYLTGLEALATALAYGCRPDREKAKRFTEYIHTYIKYLREQDHNGKYKAFTQPRPHQET